MFLIEKKVKKITKIVKNIKRVVPCLNCKTAVFFSARESVRTNKHDLQKMIKKKKSQMIIIFLRNNILQNDIHKIVLNGDKWGPRLTHIT